MWLSILTTVLALAVVAPAAVAQTTTPDVSSSPSAKNSGTGIPSASGTQGGPTIKSDIVGKSPTSNQVNPTVRQQDPANTPGLPGNKSGPPVRQPSR